MEEHARISGESLFMPYQSTLTTMSAFIQSLSKPIGVFLVAALLVGGTALPAKAQTLESLQAQIQALLAQIAALQGNTSASVTFTRDLTIGATGSEVTALQNFLIGKGHTIPAGATGYFGVQTQAALAAYQAANSIVPAVGYFGPITRAHVNNQQPSPIPSPSDDDFFSGNDEGYLDEFEQMSSLSNEEVGEDDTEEVLGVEFTAEDADQMITRVSVNFSNPTGNDDLDEFITEVHVLLDGKEIGSMDVDEASHNRNSDTYSFRFTNLEGIVEENDTAELTIAVTAVRNLDSADEGDGWTVTIPRDGIRAVSPNGVDDTYDSSAYSETFTVETFASASNLELNITLDDENPEEGVVIVDNQGDTVDLLVFEVKADGSDITLYDLPFLLTSTGADVEDMVNKLTLRWGKNSQKENVLNSNATTQTVTFDDLDIEIEDGDSLIFTLVGESATSSPYGGASLKADLTVGSIDAEDQTGEALASGDIDGTANGDAQHFFEVAPEIEVISTSISAIDNGDSAPESAVAKIKVKLTARGGAIFLNGDDETTAADEFFVLGVSGGNASTSISSWTHTVSGNYTTFNSGSDNEYYRVNEGRSITVEITGIVYQDTVTTNTVLAGMKGTAVQFGIDATDQTTRSAYSLDWNDLIDRLVSPHAPLVNPS